MSRSLAVRSSASPRDVDFYAPSAALPLRCALRSHLANTEVELHKHPWTQIVFSSCGVIRVAMQSATYTVPPWRAIWIPAGVDHTTAVLEDAELHSLHLLKACGPAHVDVEGITACSALGAQVMEVGSLLRGLVVALAQEDRWAGCSRRFQMLVSLTLVELLRAPSVAVGIRLPSERRLNAFCNAFLANPRLDRPLIELAQDAGASISTINRLFHSELGSSFSDWRKQALLAQSLALAAKGLPIAQIAFELGYSSPSAFSFMVSQLVGMPPSKFHRMAGDFGT